MKLVIAEKPSVAHSLAAVLGANQKMDGYLEGNGWRVSWCLGHLAGLADADCYDPRFAKWRREDLPIVPARWVMQLSKDKRKQFQILKALMNAPDVTHIVNACDAGREGELIFRNVYVLAGCKKPTERLWISSMEDSAIRDGFTHLRPGSDYDSLYDAAFCRAKADWLVGINATRLFSVLYHRTLNIGRVLSPTLALIVQRDQEISAFQSQPFYTVSLSLPGFNAEGERLADKAEAENLKEACVGKSVVVTNVVCKEKAEKPPLLYDLTTLQRDANRLLGYTAQQTLDYLQSLYEKKLCTYPRTDSRYLTSDMEESLPQLVQITAQAMPFAAGVKIACNTSQVVNDKKVTDHHAVIPTRNLDKINLDELPVGERSILELVARRLFCAVGQVHRYAETIVTVRDGNHDFTAKGKRVLVAGWKAYMPKTEKESDTPLPDLAEGQCLSLQSATVKEGKTCPPKSFTEDTLLSAMENAGVKDTPEDAERKGLGTPATRAGILEKLISTGFVERRKNKKAVHLIASPDAVSLMKILPTQLQSPLLTAEWESRLGQIEHNQLSAQQFMVEITDMVQNLVEAFQMPAGTEQLFASPLDIVGKCPRCGSNISENKRGFFCQNPSCKFAIWKNSKWWTAKKKQPTKEIVTELLQKGRVPVKGFFSEKTGRNYDAIVVLDDTGTYVNFKLEFQNQKGSKP